jgi:L-threonylcarbamoyladenylate synthase
MVNSESLSKSSANDIQKAAERLKSGHLVAFPTETVYGLGADATNENAVKRIYQVKGRPTDHPLIVHLSSINALNVWAKEIPEYSLDLARAFWPGPMTLILKRTEIAKDFITGGQESVGVRVPSDPIAQKLLAQFESLGGFGIAAPSANRFGRVSPTSSADVIEELGNYLLERDLIIEGGRSTIGLESTIIDCTSKYPKILRPGAVTRQEIGCLLDFDLTQTQPDSNVRVSGDMEKHYSPKARVILNSIPKPGQAMFAMKEFVTPVGVTRIGSPTNVKEFARDIYWALRETDRRGMAEVVVITPNEGGLAEAILERLIKSSRGRTR